MKFLCLDCDEPMRLLQTEGPDEGSLSVVFRCPECGFRVAMLTNPFETQMVRSLGVKVGGRTVPAEPFEHVRASMASARPDAFQGAGAAAAGGEVEAEAEGPGCPFAAMVNEAAREAPTGVTWTPEAEARLERVPAFIRPMAKKAIERYAEGKGYGAITEPVMDEARGVMGM
jgi:DNA-directed RNA polymerase subunit RPC12/RpoP